MNTVSQELNLYQNIFQASVEGILVVDQEGSILSSNPASEQMFGYTHEELRNRKVESLIPQEFRKNHKKYRTKYLENPKGRRMGQQLELWGLKQNGLKFPVEVSLSPTTIKNNNVVVAFIIDITQRKNATDAQVLSEGRMAEAQRVAKIGSWYWNVQTNERSWSDEFYRICGLSPKDKHLTAETLIQCIHPDDREKALKAVDEAFKNKVPYNYKKRIIRPDGSTRYVIAIGNLIHDEHGKPLEMVGTLQDVTENTLVNSALRESNRKFSTLIDNLQGIVYRCKNDRNWTMEYISEGCFEITGYAPKDFLSGKVHLSNITLMEDQEQVWKATQKAIDTKSPFHVTYRIKDKNGGTKYMIEKGIGIFDKHGNLEALEGFITDITKHKETEIRLLKSEAKTKALFEAIPDMIFIQNRDGVFLDWYSNTPEKLFMPPEQFIGKNMKEVLPPEVYQKLKRSQERLVLSSDMQITEYCVERENGLNYYEARVVLMNDHSLLTIVRDVTEEKNASLSLNIRNNALASAINSIIIVDAVKPNMPIIYCNKAFTAITGYPEKEVLGRNCNFLQNDDRDQLEIDIMREAIAKGEACSVLLRNYKKNGTMFWNEVTITPVFDEDKKLTHFVGVQNDVSDKVEKESLKNQIKEILELIAKDKSLKTIATKIVSTIESTLEGAMASMLLLNKDQQALHKLVAPNVPKGFSDYIDGTPIGPNAGSSGAAAFYKKEIIVSDIENDAICNQYKAIALKHQLKACWSVPIISSDNEVLGTLTIYRLKKTKPSQKDRAVVLDLIDLASVAIEKDNNNIALKEYEKELEKYTHKLEEKVQDRTEEVMATVQKLVETNLSLEDQIQVTQEAERTTLATKTLLSIVAKNFPRGAIVVMNDDFYIDYIEGEELDRVGLRDIITEGVAIDDIGDFSKGQKTNLKKYIKKTLDGEHLSFEISFKGNPYLVNTTPLYNQEEQVVQALLVYNNISEQKRVEREILKALKREQELSELKSRFISMASHEFRTPLTAINSSAILIKKQNEPGKVKEREKYIDQIKKNVNNLVVILNDFLSLSKLQEGKTSMIPTSFDLVDFCYSIIKEIEPTTKEGQIIQYNHDPQSIDVFLDSKLVKHIVLNLLSNAIKYSSEQDTITLNTFTEEGKVKVEVIDEGIGIPVEDQHNLFQRFFRAANVANIQGTGLGLHIVEQYTKLMGGSIHFKSEPGKGSTFFLEFPKKSINDEKNTFN